LRPAAIEAEFGVPLDTLFRDFSDVPVAAASIAQVHFATTIDGRDVAVKVLRPAIEDAFRRDLALFRWVAALIEKTAPEARRLKPVESVEIMAETVTMEPRLVKSEPREVCRLARCGERQQGRRGQDRGKRLR